MVDATIPGDYEPGATIKHLRKLNSAAIVKGQLLVPDVATGGLKTSPTTVIAGPYFVAVRAAATADTICTAGVSGIFYLVADGVILPNTPVSASTTTAGRVIAYAMNGTPTATTAGAEFRLVVGIYLGHLDENDGNTVPTSAAAGETIRVLLSSGGKS